MRIRFIAAVPIVLLGCATSIEHVALDWRLVDHPEENRIELFYLNGSGGTLCLSPSDWPNLGGKLNQMGGFVFLVVGNERFPIENFNTGFCPDGCIRRVKPGEEISGSIPYKDFNLPDHLRFEPKSLEFSPQAYVCR